MNELVSHRAGFEVERLLAGFRRSEGRGRYLMPLEAYFDDCGSSGRDRVYVLGGFVAPYGNWIEFSDAWQAALDEVGLAYFKTHEAIRFEGQFARGWSPGMRDALMLRLAEVVRGHAVRRVSATVMRSHFDEFFSGMPVPLEEYREPYSLLFWGICRMVIEWQFRTSQIEPCDFIFDEQGTVGLRALSWWPQWPLWINPERKHLLGNPPIFRDDKRVRPLQAADMYANLVKEKLRIPGGERWQFKALYSAMQPTPILNYHLNRERLSILRASLAVNHASFFGLI